MNEMTDVKTPPHPTPKAGRATAVSLTSTSNQGSFLPFPENGEGVGGWGSIQLIVILALLLTLTWMTGVLTIAQGETGSPVRVVTDDEVNAISKKLFCPVCENIPLDTCGTAACADWRYEIRLQLEAGMTEQEIIDDFIYRFGERVVHIPKALHLRLLSLAVPVIAIAAALFVSVRFYNNRRRESEMEAPSESRTAAESDYHALLEKDVAG